MTLEVQDPDPQALLDFVVKNGISDSEQALWQKS